MKPNKDTIIRALQSRIDKRSNEIDWAEAWKHSQEWGVNWKNKLKELRKLQALDKRIYGLLINSLRNNKPAKPIDTLEDMKPYHEKVCKDSESALEFINRVIASCGGSDEDDESV